MRCDRFICVTYIIYTYIRTADPTWGDIFECCFKAQSSKVECLFSLKSGKRDVRALSFELPKMSPQLRLAVCVYVQIQVSFCHLYIEVSFGHVYRSHLSCVEVSFCHTYISSSFCYVYRSHLRCVEASFDVWSLLTFVARHICGATFVAGRTRASSHV